MVLLLRIIATKEIMALYSCVYFMGYRSWRREGDSNPRTSCPVTRFPSVRTRPLCDPSERRNCSVCFLLWTNKKTIRSDGLSFRLFYSRSSLAFFAASLSCFVSVLRVEAAIVMRTYFPVFGSRILFLMRFGKNRRLVARFEKERRFPEAGPFPVI